MGRRATAPGGGAHDAGAPPTGPDRLIQAVFYNDPDVYPPIVNSARLLAGEGFTLDLFCRDSGERWGVAYPPAVRLHRIDARGHGSWREYLAFVRQVLRRGGRAGVFVGHDMHGFLAARLLAARYRRPLVYHCHDFVARARDLAPGGRVVKAFEQGFARTADLVIVPDAARGAVVARALRLRRPPLIVANAPIARPAAGGEALARALAARGQHFARVLFRQGRIGVGHAIEATVRSIPHWPRRDWGFVVMGPGDPAYLAHLAGLARALGVERQFAILPPVGYDEVAQFTAGADAGHALYDPIHINNVHITTASNKIMEYMAAGLPLLVADSPAMIALVANYGCGVTADQRSPEGIAVAVSALLGDRDLARRMGAAGAREFDASLSYERQFAPALATFRHWCDHSSGARLR